MDIELVVKTGVTFTQTFLWQEQETGQTPVRRSLAGMRAKAQFRKKVGYPVLFELSSANETILIEEIVVNNDSTGTFTLVIPGPLSNLIKETSGVFDVKFETDSLSGEPSYRPIEGTVVFDLAVTK